MGCHLKSSGLKIYTHLSDEHKQKNIDKLYEFITNSNFEKEENGDEK